MNPVDELGYTTRALIVMDERHNEKRFEMLGHEMPVDPVKLKRFKAWQKNIYAKEYGKIAQRNLALQRIVERDASIVCEKSDYDGETIPRLASMETQSNGARYAYLLKLSTKHTDSATAEPRPIDLEVSKALTACENDSIHDELVRGGDAYKKL